MKIRTTPLLATAVLVCPLALTACQGPESGRVGVSDTTPAETASAQVLPTALIEFSDKAPRELVRDLSHIKAIQDTKGPVTVILGDINNKTGIVSSNDFEVAMQRMRNNLINSSVANSKLQFVEPRARMEALSRREQVGSPNGTKGPLPYDPGKTYVLLGSFYRINRGNTNLYYMQFHLARFANNVIVGPAMTYTVKQVQTD